MVGPANADVNNYDLPGPGNPNNNKPITVLQEFPYGRRSDEGRAMLQILHDIAPKAELAFHSGFISPGNFAEGIKALDSIGCDIIVDDVTFITEPYFTDGVVSQAVDEVAANGVSYFTAAGNFGSASYEGTFNPVPAPSGFTGFAHDFGGGDLYQNVSLKAGSYTIVLQWEDAFYSLGQQPGALNDFDIYLVNNSGAILFGFNRNNHWKDPFEVLPFTVSGNTQANIMITRKSGTGNVKIKYIVFRGDATINEHNQGTSTIVGQANATGAISVGAVLYSNTPVYGVNPPTVASFSSEEDT
ncbi:MAG: hypothetical protein IPP46_00450 [Bacteroidetes bacterium]|nr:hypothetical protein [Bacteroidota bacterium]